MTLALARVGVLVPSTDTTLERELPQLLAGRASVHPTRMCLPDVTPDGLAAMGDNALDGAELLADLVPDVVVFGCTSGSFAFGAEHERHLAQEIADRAGAPVITAASAVRSALCARGRTVRVRTPYTTELTGAECAYLRAAGLAVSCAAGMGLTRDHDIAGVTPERLLAHVAGDDEADVLLVSCEPAGTGSVVPAGPVPPGRGVPTGPRQRPGTRR